SASFPPVFFILRRRSERARLALEPASITKGLFNAHCRPAGEPPPSDGRGHSCNFVPPGEAALRNPARRRLTSALPRLRPALPLERIAIEPGVIRARYSQGR